MRPAQPGRFFGIEILDELGSSVSRAAEMLEVRRATLSDFVNEQAALSTEMALRVEKVFGVWKGRNREDRPKKTGTTNSPLTSSFSSDSR